MAAFGPLFAWGASGDLWPAILVSVCFGLGVYVVYALRGPLLEFLDRALSEDRSITVHEFIARQHGGDPRVRLLAAGLSLCALLGLIGGEALALTAFLRPILGGSVGIACLLVLGALLLIVSSAAFSGHSGIMHSAQVQLGMLYLGLLGATIVLVYMHLSARTPMPARGTLAVLVIAVCSATLLCYRSTKYVDTDPIRGAASQVRSERVSPAARALSRFEKLLNIVLSVLLALTIVVAAMEGHAAGWGAVARDSAAALRAATQVPGVGLVALCLLPLFHPLVDVTNWLRLAATRKDAGSAAEAGRALRRVMTIYAVETSLLWLFMCMFGAVAVVAVGAQGGADVVQAFVARLVAADTSIGAAAMALLLICVFAVALSTMSALFSASLCTVRYDLLPPLWPALAPKAAPVATESRARRVTLAVVGGLSLAFVAAFCLADAAIRINVASGTFLGLLFAVCCAQLSFAPLLLGPIVGRARGRPGHVAPGWALAILGSGAACGVGAVTVYAATGLEAWLWSAAPACLGSGLVLFAVARPASRRPA